MNDLEYHRYKGDKVLGLCQRARAKEGESEGTNTPQERIHGMNKEYYKMVEDVFTPFSQEEVDLLKEESAYQAVLSEKLAGVNKKTNQLIESGWIYPAENGQKIRLTGVDQANYEGEKNLYAELAYDGVDVAAYFPVGVKVWTGKSGEPIMFSMTNLAAYKTFIRMGKNHIRAKLKEGWLLKMQLIAMTLKDLQTWEDIR